VIDVIEEAPDVCLHNPAVATALERFAQLLRALPGTPSGTTERSEMASLIALHFLLATADAFVVEVFLPDRFQHPPHGVLHDCGRRFESRMIRAV
jgi:hypothetical protein